MLGVENDCVAIGVNGRALALSDEALLSTQEGLQDRPLG